MPRRRLERKDLLQLPLRARVAFAAAVVEPIARLYSDDFRERFMVAEVLSAAWRFAGGVSLDPAVVRELMDELGRRIDEADEEYSFGVMFMHGHVLAEIEARDGKPALAAIEDAAYALAVILREGSDGRVEGVPRPRHMLEKWHEENVSRCATELLPRYAALGDGPITRDAAPRLVIPEFAPPIAIERVQAPTSELRELIAELNEALGKLYPEDQRHGLALDQLFRPSMRFFLVRWEGAPAGCGGIEIDNGTAELKRMYTRPKMRRRGVAQSLLHRLEAEARVAGATILLLETGVYQPEAVRLYKRAGFARRAPFGRYAAMPASSIVTSLFMEKPL